MKKFRFLEKNESFDNENNSSYHSLVELTDAMNRRIEQLEQMRRYVALNCLPNHSFSPEAERRLFNGI